MSLVQINVFNELELILYVNQGLTLSTESLVLSFFVNVFDNSVNVISDLMVAWVNSYLHKKTVEWVSPLSLMH